MDPEIITVCFIPSGEKIPVKKSVLLKMQYFKSKIERWNNETNEINLEMNPDIFREIIKYLEDSSQKLPVEYLPEIDYIGLVGEDKPIKTNNENKIEIPNELLANNSRGDAFYTGDPQVTIHKNIYKRMTNFLPQYTKIGTSYDHKTNEYIVKIPVNISYPSYFIFDINFKEIKLVPEYDAVYNLEWIDFLDAHIIDYVDVYHGETYITKINGEAIFIDNIIHRRCIKYNSLTNILVPFHHYFYPTNTVILNGLTEGNEINFIIKFRDLSQLLIMVDMNGNEHKISPNELKKILMADPNNYIKNISVTVKSHLLDKVEIRCMCNNNHEWLVPIYHTYVHNIKEKNNKNKYVIDITGNLFLQSIHLYVRGKDLFPEDMPIIDVELYIDDKKISFEPAITKITNYVEMTQQIKTLYDLTHSIMRSTESTIKHSFDYLFENICSYYHYYIPTNRGRSIILDLYEYKCVQIKIKLKESYDYLNKDIVVVIKGEDIMQQKILKKIPNNIDIFQTIYNTTDNDYTIYFGRDECKNIN